MIRFSNIVTILILVTLVFPIAIANIETNMRLLAVSENEDGTRTGGMADLTLEIVENGRGRVFIDTFPLTRLDTQISTRIANQIACSMSQTDCEKYDFIYTIQSGSPIIGGPSAGAAITAITLATLDGHNIDPGVSMTGTISTGGFIGPVGGIREKIEAASRNRIHTVLIAQGARQYTEITPMSQSFNIESRLIENRTTIDLVAFGDSRGVRVIEVSSIYDAMRYVANVEYNIDETELEIPQFYLETMQGLAQNLCQRADEIRTSLNIQTQINNQTLIITPEGFEWDVESTVLPNSRISIQQTFESMIELRERGQIAYEQNQFYSAASFCYGSGLNARFLSFIDKNFTEIETVIENAFEEFIPLPADQLKTITQLQTHILVEERLTEARQRLIDAREESNEFVARNLYAIAIERLFSAQSWATFFFTEGQVYQINTATLYNSCDLRIREADIRRSFVELYIPQSQAGVDSLNRAREFRQTGSYELCLHEASRAKANADLVLSLLGFEEDQLELIVEQRKLIVQRVIANQASRGIFPIIGYSYFEYGKSLAQTDPVSALLYFQYALELSNFDMYFPRESQSLITRQRTSIQSNPTTLFILGICVGVILLALSIFVERQLNKVLGYSNKKKSKRKK